jgi:hypothetical protein
MSNTKSSKEKFSLSFTLSVLPLTLNEMMGKHWRTRHSNFDLIHNLIAVVTRRKKPAEPIKKARITVTRYSSGTLDRDNMYFTFKPIIDGLVMAGIIIDDGFDQVKELNPIQVKIKRNEPKKVDVLVEEL